MKQQIQSLFARKSVTVIFCPDQDSKNTVDYRLIDIALDTTTNFYEISLKVNKPPFDLAKDVNRTITTERANETAFSHQFNPEWYLIDLAPVEIYYDNPDNVPEFCNQLLQLDAIAQTENAKLVLILATSDPRLTASMVTTYLAEKATGTTDHFTLVAVTRKYPLQLTITNGTREGQTIDFPPDPETVY